MAVDRPEPALTWRAEDRGPEATTPRKRSTKPAGLFGRVWAQGQAKVGMALTGLVLAVALIGPLLLPWVTGYGATEFAGRPFHSDGILGTDDLGRDVLTRFFDGGTQLLLYSLLATLLGLVVGAIAGLIAAYAGGRFDGLIMRCNDVLLAVPQLVFALLAITVLGPQGWVLITVIGITHAPRVARIARSAAVDVITEDYVRVSEMYAVPRWRIITYDVLPNITGPLMVELGLRMTYSIGAIASLSFLGLGMQPPAADWGLMINENRIALLIQPWGVILPVIAIAVLTVGTNLITDSIARASADTSTGK